MARITLELFALRVLNLMRVTALVRNLAAIMFVVKAILDNQLYGQRQYPFSQYFQLFGVFNYSSGVGNGHFVHRNVLYCALKDIRRQHILGVGMVLRK